MEENDTTILHKAAQAAVFTSMDLSDKSYQKSMRTNFLLVPRKHNTSTKGIAIPASIRDVLKFFPDLERLRAH